jgi:hypothetical protein
VETADQVHGIAAMAGFGGARTLQRGALNREGGMRETALYEIGLRFTVDNRLGPPRKALHGALETVRGVVVQASSLEEAEAQVDQIRLALEHEADRSAPAIYRLIFHC